MDSTADRFAITELYGRYCWALSTHNWKALDSLVAPEAPIDATAFGGPALPWSAFTNYVVEALNKAETFYTVTNVVIDLRPDDASAVAAFVADLVFPGEDGSRVQISEGGWFLDELGRSEDGGWIVTSRVEKLGYMHSSVVVATT